MSKKVCEVEPELLRQHEAPRRSRPWSRRGSCCCRSWRPGPRRASPAWITALAIGSRNGSRLSNAVVGAADHEGQRAGRGRGDAARDRRVDDVEARGVRLPRRPRARWRRRSSSNRSAARRAWRWARHRRGTPRGHASPPGSMVTTTSASLTASAAEAAGAQPPSAACRTASATGRRRGPHAPPWRGSAPCRRPCGRGR